MALVLLKASEADLFELVRNPEEGVESSERDTITHLHSLDSKTQILHQQAMNAAESFRRSEADLIDALIAVDSARVFMKIGYSSLFRYAVKALKLSEATAYNTITVARKAREVPALQDSIRRGDVSVSKAKKIAAVLTSANQDEWIKKAGTLSSRQLEKEVARENPRLATPERATYVSGKRLELTLGVDEPLMLKLRRAQDQVSRSKGRGVSLEETLEAVVDFYLQHKDPVEKAKRVIAKKGMQPKSSGKDAEPPAHKPQLVKEGYPTEKVDLLVPGRVTPDLSTPPQRTPIPAHIAHAVRLRDHGRCQHQTSGQPHQSNSICGEHRWIDLHHILPFSQGGAHTTDNLITLCKAHHRQTHTRPMIHSTGPSI